jgi:hypothetical protein
MAAFKWFGFRLKLGDLAIAHCWQQTRSGSSGCDLAPPKRSSGGPPFAFVADAVTEKERLQPNQSRLYLLLTK